MNIFGVCVAAIVVSNHQRNNRVFVKIHLSNKIPLFVMNLRSAMSHVITLGVNVMIKMI